MLADHWLGILGLPSLISLISLIYLFCFHKISKHKLSLFIPTNQAFITSRENSIFPLAAARNHPIRCRANNARSGFEFRGKKTSKQTSKRNEKLLIICFYIRTIQHSIHDWTIFSHRENLHKQSSDEREAENVRLGCKYTYRNREERHTARKT